MTTSQKANLLPLIVRDCLFNSQLTPISEGHSTIRNLWTRCMPVSSGQQYLIRLCIIYITKVTFFLNDYYNCSIVMCATHANHWTLLGLNIFLVFNFLLLCVSAHPPNFYHAQLTKLTDRCLDVLYMITKSVFLTHLQLFNNILLPIHLRGRSQLSTFMKAYTAYARGDGSVTTIHFPSENQHLFLITDNVL